MSKRRSSPTRKYEVGYKKPPKAHQFKKGRSGNCRGRIGTSSNSLDVFKRIVAQKIKLSDNGTERIMTLGEAVLVVNFRHAVKGNQSALNNFDGIMDYAQMLLDLTDESQVGGVIAIPERPKDTAEFLAIFGGGPDSIYQLGLELTEKQAELRELQEQQK